MTAITTNNSGTVNPFGGVLLSLIIVPTLNPNNREIKKQD